MSLVQTKIPKALTEHQLTVINAAYTYVNLEWCTLYNLTRWFDATENEVSYWLCEAISDNLLANDDVCKKLSNKHIEEYERTHHLNNSSLRNIYSQAFSNRNTLRSKCIS